MMNKKIYVKYNSKNEIVAKADWNFPGSIEIQDHVEIQPDGTYKIIKPTKLSTKILKERDSLIIEMNNLKNWLKEHDYIGTKIATGRATIDDYKTVIEEMKLKSERISEIKERLEKIEKFGK